MKLRLICSLLLVPVLAISAAADEWGNISGQILVDGKAPAQAKIKPDKDKAVCGRNRDLKDKSLIVGKNGGLQNAVLMMSMSRNYRGQFKGLKIHPDYKKTAKDKVLFDNKGCLFQPRVSFVRTSQTLTAKNSDPTGHNVDIRSTVNPVNKQIPSRKSLDIKIEGPDRLPVQVACGSHPWMSGRLIFRDEPYVAITGEDGKFEIKNMPAGEWTFVFWHENAGYLKDLVNAKGEKVLSGRPSVIKITVKAGETTDLGVMKIPVDSVKPE